MFRFVKSRVKECHRFPGNPDRHSANHQPDSRLDFFVCVVEITKNIWIWILLVCVCHIILYVHISNQHTK